MAEVFISSRLIGEKELLKELDKLPLRVEGRGVRLALSAGATPILKSMKRRVKSATGTLRRSLRRKGFKGLGRGEYVMVLGPDKDHVESHGGVKMRPVNYAHLVEYGRKAFGLKDKKVLASRTKVYGTKVGAVSRQPFMRPAFDAHHKGAVALAGKRLWKFINERKGAPS